MADKNRQAGGKVLIPAQAFACLIAIVAPCGTGWALSDRFTPTSYLGSADPNMVWEMLIGGIVVSSFLAAIALWTHSALRSANRSELRRDGYGSSDLNHLSQGVLMTDAQQRIVLCNDRYLEIYGLVRSDRTRNMTGPELLEVRRERGWLDVSVEDFYKYAERPEGLISELPNRRSVLAKYFALPNGGSVATHEDWTLQRKPSQQTATTKHFLERVAAITPVPLTVGRGSDGKYFPAHRGAEGMLNRRREDATGLTAADIFNPREAKLIIARDEAAIKKRGLLTEEHPISTKDGLRLFLTRRMTVLDEAGEPQYLIKTHEDVTDRRQTESRMAHMAYHDGLTDLPNRAAFLQALAQMIEACGGTNEEFAVLSVDLDGLKEINDAFGHAIAAKLLIG